MKVSIIIPILDSHEIFKRQCLYFEKIGIPDDTEIIIMDDGSDIPLTYSGPLNLRIVYTNDKRPWTSSLARNIAARQYANGEYLIMYDVDHILSKEALDMVRTFGGQKIQFSREFGVLLEDGTLTQDLDTLISYGFPKSRYSQRKFSISPHPNMFAMRKDVFLELGCYREDLVEKTYPQGEDSRFKRQWHKWVVAGKGETHPERPLIYMFPNGKLCGDVDYNPFGLFHTLSRATNRNPYWRKQRKEHGYNRNLRFS